MTPPATHYDPTTGKVWAPHQITYTHGGVEFDVRICATSFAHAEAMLADLKASARLAGVIVLEEA